MVRSGMQGGRCLIKWQGNAAWRCVVTLVLMRLGLCMQGGHRRQ